MENAGAGFGIDAKLLKDTHEIGKLALCRVLLVNDARFPWLILVPQRAGIAEIIDLTPADQQLLWREIAQASLALKTVFQPDKLNVAALGNVVRQLHVHVIARFASDAAWPKPVWGVGEALPFQPHQLAITADRIAAALGIDED